MNSPNFRPSPTDVERPRAQVGLTNSFLNTAEAAQYVRVARGTLAKWRCAGGGPEYVLVGRKVLYALVTLDAWLDSRRRHHTSEQG